MDEGNYWQGWMRRRMGRRIMLRRLSLAGIALAGGSSLLACNTSQAPKSAEPAASSDKPKRGGILKVATKAEEITDLDPINLTIGLEHIKRGVYDWLVNYDVGYVHKPEMSLAESWEVKDDVTLVFKLRKGIKFADGSDFNAQVIKFNFDRHADPKIVSSRAQVVKQMKSVEYPDDYTVKIVLNQPSASIFGDLSQTQMQMISPTHVAKYTAEQLKTRAMGSGPFQQTEFAPDDHFLMTRFDGHWTKDKDGGQLPYLDGVNFVPVPDDTVRLANLRQGIVDVMQDVPYKDVARVQEEKNIKIYKRDGQAPSQFFWDLSKPPISNLNFRKALTYATNREVINKTVFFGLVVPYNGIVMPIYSEWDAKKAVIPYDPQRAKQHLDKAVAEGVKPEFAVFYSATDPTGVKTLEIMQADLAQIGIKMNLSADNQASARYVNKHELPIILTGGVSTPDSFSKIHMSFHSKGAYSQEKYTVAPGWDTPEGYYKKLDPILDAANRTYDPKKRAELLYQASDIVVDNVGSLGIVFKPIIFAATTRVEGLIQGGEGYPRFHRAWLKT